MAVFLTLGFRMRRFSKSIDTVIESNRENDLEFVIGYLRSIWQLLAGAFLAALVISAIAAFFAILA